MINSKSLSGQETFTDLSKLRTNLLYPITSCGFNLSLKILVTSHIYNYSVLIFFLSQLTLKYFLTFCYRFHCCFYSTLIFSKKQNSCVLLWVDFFCSKFSHYIIPYVYINSIHTRDGLCVFKSVISCILHIKHIIHLEIENATVKILNKQSPILSSSIFLSILMNYQNGLSISDR